MSEATSDALVARLEALESYNDDEYAAVREAIALLRSRADALTRPPADVAVLVEEARALVAKGLKADKWSDVIAGFDMIADALTTARSAGGASEWKAPLDDVNRHYMREMGLFGLHSQSRFLALALCGEAGELANLIKKEWRDGETPERDREIAEEIADVQIYLHHLATARGLIIDVECSAKLAKLRERWPEAFLPSPQEPSQ